MTVHLVEALALLVLPAVVPSAALTGVRPLALVLAPLGGAVLAALAALLELALGGTLVTWFAVLAVAANGAAAVWLVRAGRPRWSGWSTWWAGPVVVAGALAWSLTGLRAPIVSYDAHTFWILHALWIYGGHRTYLAAVKNPAYVFSNQDYPPLVSAAGALAFVAEGKVDYRLAEVVTTVLNADALALVALGIAAAGRRAGGRSRAAAWVAGAAVCLAGFGVAGINAVNGEADLLWAACAAAAVVYGLVLAPSSAGLAVAGVSLVAASLTKNEGSIMAVVVAVLVAFRFVAPPRRVLWLRRAALAGLLVLPGAAWALLLRVEGVGNFFFGPTTVTQPASQRLAPTLAAVSHHLVVLPVAMIVALVGWTFLRRERAGLGLANPLWLWMVCGAYLAVLVGTYVFGSLRLQWWLSSSVARTSIFAEVLLFADLAVWLTVALAGRPGPASPAGARP